MDATKPSERIEERYAEILRVHGSREQAKDAALNLAAEILDELHAELIRVASR